jgi:DNA polymerase III subunit gamma/tau
MSYKALYRTYRPLSFLEVAGQKHIVKTLQNALNSNKVAHAYLFAGPRGTGKTSMAKLMAKALNCEQGIGQQCNKCENCLAVNDNSHPDVIEIDAASNNGVDEVRDLIEKVKYSPIKGKFKIYIIDEVHMMTTGAFNALLKTLEEPPAHVVFILATTEPYKLIPTILSRCQRYDFTKVSSVDIKERMRAILDKENIAFENRAVDTLISLADGGVRDALSMLDQVLAYSQNELKEEDILDLFGLIGTAEKINLLKLIALSDIGTILSKLDEFANHGADIKRLCYDLLDILKDLLIYLKTNKDSLLTVLTPIEADELLKIIEYTKIPVYIDMLLKSQSDFRYVGNVRSLFEVTLLKMATLDSNDFKNVPETPVKKIDETKPPIEKEKQVEEKTPTSVEDVASSSVTSVVDEIKHEPADISFLEKEINNDPEEAPKAQLPEIEPIDMLTEGDGLTIDDDNIIKIMTGGLRQEKNRLLERWLDLEQLTIDPKIGKFASLLRDGRPYVLSKDVLILEYDLPTLINKINLVHHQKILQDIVFWLLGKRVIIYAFSRNESIRLKKVFLNLSQIGKLPGKDNLAVHVEGWVNERS